MVRSLISLILLAVLLFGPLHHGTDEAGAAVSFTGYDYVSEAMGCWRDGNHTLKGACEPEAGIRGKALFAAMFLTAVVALISPFVAAPIVGRMINYICRVFGILIAGFVVLFAVTHSYFGSGSPQWAMWAGVLGGILIALFSLLTARRRFQAPHEESIFEPSY
ncbi:MAG: hypothetical protein R3C40_03435 [Parvularculaceae bacterium]